MKLAEGCLMVQEITFDNGWEVATLLQEQPLRSYRAGEIARVEVVAAPGTHHIGQRLRVTLTDTP